MKLSEILRPDTGALKPGQKITIKKSNKTYTLVSFMSKGGDRVSPWEKWDTEEEGRKDGGVLFHVYDGKPDTQYIVVEAKETEKLISVLMIDTSDKGELIQKIEAAYKKALKNKEVYSLATFKLTDECADVVKNFVSDRSVRSNYVRNKREITKVDSERNILMALEGSATSMMELPAINEYDIVMIGGNSFVKIGSMSDFVYIPIDKK